jgi:hypothetical protein
MSTWVFDEPPASRSRSGGNPANEAFEGSIHTFVREVLQNSKDARTESARQQGKAAEVEFELKELTGDRATKCMGQLGWESLRHHLDGSLQESKDVALRKSLERFRQEEKVVLLRISDKNTSGLTGPEFGDEDEAGKYALLCRDELYSDKPLESAGGSHGLGKAVLWRFSSFSTVYFNSDLCTLEGGNENPRLVGRTALPWHRTNGNSYQGDGWFGAEKEGKRGRYAVSVWGDDARSIADGTPLERKNGGPGTTILIAGFTEPAEEDRPLEETADEIRRAAAEWFWPSLLGSDPSLWVSVKVTRNDDTVYEEQVQPRDYENLDPLIDAWERHNDDATVDELGHPGDVAAVPVEVELPRREDGAFDSVTARATLVVRLAAPAEEDTPHCNQVAYFRGAGMVVKYRNFRQLGLSARPYHAFLATGFANGESESNKALEYFLRDSEPPEHDEWKSTKKLKNNYVPGYKKALDEIDNKVRDVLIDLVTKAPDSRGTQGPSRLRKKFPIGNQGGGDPGEASVVTIDELSAFVKDDELFIEGAIRIRSRSPGVWESTLDFSFAEEDSRKQEEACLEEFNVEDSDVRSWLGDSEVRFVVPEGKRKVRFSGKIRTRGVAVDPHFASIEGSIVGNEVDDN